MEDTKMEQALRNLLDFQRFAQNKRLNALITQTEERYRQALSDEDLDWVNAAGEPEGYSRNEESHEPH